ncbi:MAG: SBBP repeat-containing protein [Solirubrobacteraceae bacterium]
MASYGRLPLGFEPNVAPSDRRVRFLASSGGGTVFLASDEAVLALAGAGRSHEPVLRVRFMGAADPQLRGVARLSGSANYFVGRDRARWRVDVPMFARVRYRHLWPGVDASFYGNGSQLQYDFELSPGADPTRIALRFVGAREERFDSDGGLVLTLPGGSRVRELAPVAYQGMGRTRRPVAVRFVLSAGVAHLALGPYDHGEALTVDPALVYSTYLGGSGEDAGNAIAVDAAGDAYVTGFTFSTNFPTTPGAYQTANAGGEDAFVAKLNAAGDGLLYATYLGGSGTDDGHGIAVDSAGDAYVAGSTTSTNFPTTPGAYQTANAGGEDAFVAKLNAAGALDYSTYLGGGGDDLANAIAVDAAGEAYATGLTESTSFPTASPLQSTLDGLEDAFVTKLNTTGSGLVYSTYLGGSGSDVGFSIAVDSAGEAYVAGETGSTNFPTIHPLQAANAGGEDGFVAKLNTTGSGLVYSTYLGGAGTDFANGIAVDSAGDAYITGYTASTNFPTLDAVHPSCGDPGCTQGDAFVAKLNPAGTLGYSTYLGGSGADEGNAVAVDGTGEAYVTGVTFSADFPTLSPEQLFTGGGRDAFVTKLNPAGNALVYSTYLGGSGDDYGYGIALDPAGDAFVTGFTMSTNFPTAGPLQPACGDSALCGEGDAFVAKLPFDVTPPTSTASIAACHGPVTVTVTDNPGGSGPKAVDFVLDGGAEQTISTTGNPGVAQIPVPEGNHTLEYWGVDAAGNQESPHHVASVQVDTTPPTLTITSDQGFLAYEVGDRASVTIAASDAISGLATNPSASHVPISTAKPGRFAITRSATDRCGNRATASFTYTVVPPPAFAVSVDVEPVSGKVRLRKGRQFVALTEARAIPVNSTIDATRGTIRLTTATSVHRQYQTGTFGGGVFNVVQQRSQRGLVELHLIDPSTRLCTPARKAVVARLSPRVLALLHSNVHGSFRTRGRYSAATVRGTAWTIEDRCDGTLTVVTRGTVLVLDFALRRTIAVRAGQSYLARAL